MKLLIFLTALFSQSNALACSILNDGPVKEVINVEGNSELDCSYVSRVEQTFLSVLQFSEDKSAVNLLVHEIYNNAGYDGGYNIEVPEQLVFTGEWSDEYHTDVYANLTVVAHEYGHALLETKLERDLGKEFPEVIQAINKQKEVSLLRLKSSKEPENAELKKLLEGKSTELYSDANAIKYFGVTAAYSELYADVIAVYEANDKNAIFNSLYYPAMKMPNYYYTQTRSFDTDFTTKHERFMSESHAYFAYTRSFIGKNLWPKNNDEKKKMLKKIGDAIVAEVRILLKSNSKTPDYEMANKQLIKRLSN